MIDEAADRGEGGWTIHQVLVWITTRNIEITRRFVSKKERMIHALYPSFHPDYPKAIEGESTEELLTRRTQFETKRNVELAAENRLARDELFAALQKGTITAFNPSKDRGQRPVSRDEWLTLAMNSTEAQSFRYSTDAVRKLWKPYPINADAQQAAANACMLNLFNSARDRNEKKPLRDSAIKYCQRNVGVKYLQAKAAYNAVPDNLKNPRYRARKKSGD